MISLPGENPQPDKPSPLGEPIFAYTRSQALADGLLVDVTPQAREAGIGGSVAVTARLWHERIVPSQRQAELGQDQEGRLWDVLWLLRLAIEKLDDQTDEAIYEALFLNDRGQHERQPLRALCGPDDDGQPCLTIMLPDED